MKKIFWKTAVGILAIFLLSACSGQPANEESAPKQTANPVELTISAAVSLQPALTEIKTAYEEQHPNVKLFFNFGSSGALQQQISQGAPVDLFFSAAEDKYDDLVEKGLIDQKNGADLLGNELVLVQPKGADNKIDGFEQLGNAEITQVAIGTPESVPAGNYAKETLESLKIWEKVKAKTVFAKDVHQVLTYVETGNVDAGIVYKTDALGSKKVEVAATAENRWHSPIIYPLGVIKQSKHKEEAVALFHYLSSDQAVKVYEKYGFQSLKGK